MKSHFLRFLALGLACALSFSLTLKPSAAPVQPIQNLSWGKSLLFAANHGVKQTLGLVQSNLFFHYLTPSFISRWFVLPKEQIIPCVATSAAYKAVLCRYQKQIYEICGNDPENVESAVTLVPLIPTLSLLLGARLPSSFWIGSSVALVAGLQAREWMTRKRK